MIIQINLNISNYRLGFYESVIFLLIISILQIATAKEYSVEQVLSGNLIPIGELGYSSESPDCREFIKHWHLKLTNFLEQNSNNARAYYYRGLLYKFRSTCWRNTSEELKSLSREEFFNRKDIVDNWANMNADWSLALDHSAEPENQTSLSWFTLSVMFSPFMYPRLVEKKAKLQIEIATSIDLGKGTEHPIDKSTFMLNQYEQIADKYNYSDDRKNVIRILKELGEISSEGSRKANELLPLYEDAWRKRDDRAALQEKEGLLKEDETSKNNELEADTVPVDEDKTSGKAAQPNVDDHEAVLANAQSVVD